MNQQHVYRYLKQQGKLPTVKLHCYLEIEAAIDGAMGCPEKLAFCREKEMLFQQSLCKAFGIKAKQFKTVTIVWEQAPR